MSIRNISVLSFAALSLAVPSVLSAAEAVEPKASEVLFTVNNLWILVAAFLVFIMHLGFATLESGLTRAKNTCNILCKNTAIVAIGLLTYAVVGFRLMYPETAFGGEEGAWAFGKWLASLNGLGIDPGSAGQTSANGDYTYYTDFIFQGMFAATAATIVSGAVAERIKLSSFLIFSTIYVAVIYPIVGSWGWGGGWLAKLPVEFHDFAGSTFVHSVGGWGALAGVIFLGARSGKYVNGESRAIAGHSMPLAAIGVFLLWFGWYGFNGGSVLSADPAGVSLVFVTTSMGAAAGVVGAMAASWIIQKKPDLSMVLNGSLAGLVGITAGADCVTPMESIYIGGIAGILVVVAVLFIDTKLKLDDPVGATSVHLACGIWGTLAVGIWGVGADGTAFSFMSQLKGVIMTGLVCFPAASIIFLVLKYTIGIRVDEAEERRGLDIGEHGMEAYAGFQIFLNQ